MDKKVLHLQMIQAVVNRHSTNSFLLKGWSVVLVSALFALAAANAKAPFVFIAYFPAGAFWVLDGFFLRQERIYRALYDHVRQVNDDEIDFSMDPSRVEKSVLSWFDAAMSKTLLIFHATVLCSIVFVMILTER